MPDAEARALALFAATYGAAAEGGARAPGRVNLIGDHTDYNGGFVLPIAIDRDTHIAFRPRADSLVRIVSEHGEPAEFDLADLSHGDPPWSEYVRGVAWALDAHAERGWEGAIASDIPLGAGLSSSASLEVAAGVVFDSVRGGRCSSVELAVAGRRAENEWLGFNSGIMDQLVSAAGRSQHALLIDCRDLRIQPVLIPPGVEIVALDTATRRRLTESRYNDRREECEAVTLAYGIDSLRDLTLEDLNPSQTDTDSLHRRARHILSENQRTIEAARALASGNVALVGSLMVASHESLRDDYEVSGPELDAMVDAALSAPGCLGARMTGGGFAGCAVALVESSKLDDFIAGATQAYRSRTGLQPAVYVCKASDGATVLTKENTT
jgi:galactokinase